MRAYLTFQSFNNQVASVMTSQPGYRGIRQTLSRDALLDAAEMLFGSEHASDVSIDDIVARAGVAKGTFYNHFVDKADIGNQVASRIRQDLRQQIQPAKIGISDPAVHLAIAVSTFLLEARRKPHRARLMISYLLSATSLEDTANAPLRDTLVSGARLNRFGYSDLDSALTFVIGIVSAGILVIARDGAEKRPIVPKHLVELMLTGLGVPVDDFEVVIKHVPELL